MKPNFDISLPSIPGKMIKFKIQDIKQSSFGSRKPRFHDNKKNLTKKFIESFNNFHESKDQKLQQQTQASQSGQSRISHKSTNMFKKATQKFRFIIPQDKKYMIEIYENLKEHQIPIINENKFNKGYTFSKTDKQRTFNEQNNKNNDQNEQKQNKFVTDNYYFTSTILKDLKQGSSFDIKQQTHKQIKKTQREKPNASFKNQTRNKVYDRIYNTQVPGPGFYKLPTQIQKNLKKKTKNKRSVSLHQKQNDNSFNNSHNQYKRLKNIITEIIKQDQKQIIDNEQNLNEQNKNIDKPPQHMFIKDDRNRFGQQKYPIAFRLNVPGPGTYQIGNNMEEQSKKILLVQQQRKLLKEWFNN